MHLVNHYLLNISNCKTIIGIIELLYIIFEL